MSVSVKKVLKDWVIPFGLELLVILFLVKFVFFFVIVPTGSMIPTIDEHSYLFATRVHNPEKNLKRGDIVVFDSDEMGKTLVKRLIGLPGEQIVIDNAGTVFVNGQQLEEPYVKNQSQQPGEFLVPEGCYFFVGDNRASSFDGRFWQEPYINEDKITGKAVFTIWPFENFGLLK